jgi:hypothetical protein
LRHAADADGFTDTLTFTLDEAVPFAARLTVPGLTLQLTPDGAPVQAKVTVPGTKFVELSAKLKLAAPPTLTTADKGETVAFTPLMLKVPELASPAESPFRRMSPPLPVLPCQTA